MYPTSGKNGFEVYSEKRKNVDSLKIRVLTCNKYYLITVNP